MALVTSQGPGQPLARLWPAPTPQADAHPPHAQTPGSTETAASALLSADLWLTCPWGHRAAWVQSHPELLDTVMGPGEGRSLRVDAGQPLGDPF